MHTSENNVFHITGNTNGFFANKSTDSVFDPEVHASYSTLYYTLPALLCSLSSGFKQWFYSIPTFTRTYLVILLLTGFGASYGLVDPFNLIFSRELIFKRLQVPCSEIPEL